MSATNTTMQVSGEGATGDAVGEPGGGRRNSGENCLRSSSTYRQILKSSAIIGGSSVVNMVTSLVRTKVMAVLLGPAGFGLMGAFSTIADLARTIAELGINNSGVRQIAESVGTQDSRKIARTVTVLRRVTVGLGMIGGVLLATFAGPVAKLTFGNDEHTWAVALLGLAVLLRLVADGHGALLQGMRRIGDIARINIYGAILGTLLAIAVVIPLREEGVALALVCVALASLGVSWWYSRQVHVERVHMVLAEVSREARALLQLGMAFMASAMLTMGAAYVVRIILIRSDGLEGAGLFQAAWAIGGLYVTFVLQAMGTDFYPRLVASASDDVECNRLVNEQAIVSLLMGSVGVIATLTLAPLVVEILYSVKFTAATDLLRWLCLGMALRVITWPLGYILVAKGKQKMFVTADLLWTVMNVGLTWLCVDWFGLGGAGIAFLGSYLFHYLVVYPMCRKVSGFRWSKGTARAGLAFVVVIAGVQAGFVLLDPSVALVLGLVALTLSAVASVLTLRHLVLADHVPARLAWLIQFGGTKK